MCETESRYSLSRVGWTILDCIQLRGIVLLENATLNVMDTIAGDSVQLYLYSLIKSSWLNSAENNEMNIPQSVYTQDTRPDRWPNQDYKYTSKSSPQLWSDINVWNSHWLKVTINFRIYKLFNIKYSFADTEAQQQSPSHIIENRFMLLRLRFLANSFDTFSFHLTISRVTMILYRRPLFAFNYISVISEWVSVISEESIDLSWMFVSVIYCVDMAWT